jgi:hypothetical protein
MTDKETEIAALEKGYVEFRELLVPLPDAAYSEHYLGDWTLAQLLAHFAGWFREFGTVALPRVGRGERPAPEGVSYAENDPWNAKAAANAKSGAAALDDFDDAFHVFYAAAKALDESLYGVDPERGRQRIASRLIFGPGTGHFAEHRPELEAWIAARR